MFTSVKSFFATLFGQIEAETTHLLHQNMTGLAHDLIDEANRLIDLAEREKSTLKEQIDALTRQITQKDAEIEAARSRAAKAYELAATVQEKLA